MISLGGSDHWTTAEVALEGESREVTREVASGVVFAPARLVEDDELLTLERAFIEPGVARDVGEQLHAGPARRAGRTV